jgi:hypothetical protein
VKPLQQPFGHEAASQTHCPVALLHSWPDPHDPQLAPAVPHEPFDSEAYSSHVLPLQQPLAQECASQMHCPVVVLQSLFAGHGPQLTPPAPHEVFDSPESGSHVPPLQQPAHDDPPHVHAPLEQESPLAHGLHVAPPVPHSPIDCAA